MDVKTWLEIVSPLLVGGFVGYSKYLVDQRKVKQGDGKLEIESFNTLLKANQDLRKELEEDKKELKAENVKLIIMLREEQEKTGAMAKNLILNNEKIEILDKQESKCNERLERALNEIGELREKLKLL